jgi:hypothetical protein
MRESLYSRALGKLLQQRGVYRLKLNLRYAKGVADTWYSAKGSDLFLEEKWYASLPKVINLIAGKNPKLSALQQDWLTARHQEGRNVAVIVACTHGAVFLPGLSFVEPITQEEFLQRCMRTRDMADYIAGLLIEDDVTVH